MRPITRSQLMQQTQTHTGSASKPSLSHSPLAWTCRTHEHSRIKQKKNLPLIFTLSKEQLENIRQIRLDRQTDTQEPLNPEGDLPTNERSHPLCAKHRRSHKDNPGLDPALKGGYSLDKEVRMQLTQIPSRKSPHSRDGDGEQLRFRGGTLTSSHGYKDGFPKRRHVNGVRRPGTFKQRQVFTCPGVGAHCRAQAACPSDGPSSSGRAPSPCWDSWVSGDLCAWLFSPEGTQLNHAHSTQVHDYSQNVVGIHKSFHHRKLGPASIFCETALALTD